MNHLVIGMGEIGSAICQVLVEAGHTVSTIDINTEQINSPISVLHVCFPYSDDFVKEVNRYKRKYKPDLIIIYSSVAVGTTRQINRAVHIPIEGRHPRLYFGVKTFHKFIGCNQAEFGRLARKIWQPITECSLLPDSNWTEFLKLASTSKYGINIVWADYMADVTERLDMPYDYVKDWDKAYNDLYTRMHLKDLRKYVLDPPDGFIGGHCVVPNARLLNKDFPDEMLEAIIDLGEPE